MSVALTTPVWPNSKARRRMPMRALRPSRDRHQNRDRRLGRPSGGLLAMNDDVDFNSERPWRRLSNADLVELWRDSVNHAACDFDFCFDELRSVYEEAMTRGLLELPSWTAIVGEEYARELQEHTVKRVAEAISTLALGEAMLAEAGNLEIVEELRQMLAMLRQRATALSLANQSS